MAGLRLEHGAVEPLRLGESAGAMQGGGLFEGVNYALVHMLHRRNVTTGTVSEPTKSGQTAASL